MKKYDVKNCKIIKAKEIADGIFDFDLFYPEFAWAAKPGQFAHVYLPGRTLRRPISICDIDKDRGTLRIVFQIRGAGTAELAEFQEGTFLNVLAPLGNGFELQDPSGRLSLSAAVSVFHRFSLLQSTTVSTPELQLVSEARPMLFLRMTSRLPAVT